VMGAAAVDAVVEAALGLAPDSEPRTPEGVPDDVMESEGCRWWFRRRLQWRGS
jgi:hypothetical protein